MDKNFYKTTQFKMTWVMDAVYVCFGSLLLKISYYPSSMLSILCIGRSPAYNECLFYTCQCCF